MFENAYLRFRYILQYTRVLELIWDILNAVNKLQYLLSNHNICYQIRDKLHSYKNQKPCFATDPRRNHFSSNL